MTQRITCSIVGPRNDYGKAKLVATVVTTGVEVWCRYCRAPHLITREQCEEVWLAGGRLLSATVQHAQVDL